MRPLLLIAVCCLPVVIGCGQNAKSTFTTVGTKIGGGGMPSSEHAKKDDAREEHFVADQGPPQGNPPDKKGKAEHPRRIKYTADMRLIVKDLDEADAALDNARKETKGEYAKVEINNSAGAVRSGTWRIRVPVEHFHSFRAAVGKIGEVERNTIDSEDITAQYYDLKAHIENRLTARETLRELLKETGKKEMKHYLEVWNKLEEMSDEINRKQGQLKLWENLTDLTTCTVTMREKEKYLKAKPPEPAEVPTFGTRADKTWNDSWELLLAFGQGSAIVAIAVTPWLPIPLVLVGVLWLIARRLRRPATAPPVVEVVADKK